MIGAPPPQRSRLSLLTSQQEISWRLFCRLVLVLICLVSSYYFALVIAPSGLGARAPTVQQGLYPEWIGCREILLFRHSPYRPEVTRQIQIAVYGSEATGKEVNQQRFAYPAYFVFLFLPLAVLPFPVAHVVGLVGAIGLTILSLRLWSPRVTLGDPVLFLTAVIVFAAYPVVLGVQLCQPTLLITGLLALVVYWTRSGRLLWAGILAGLCVSKPHIAIGFLLPLSIWALLKWHQRKSFLIAFGSSTVALLAASELLLPGWFWPWLATVCAYSHYAGSKPLLMELLHGHLMLPAIALLLGATVVVSYRCCESDLVLAISFSIASFQLLFPFLIYNQIALLPATLWLLQNRSRINAAGQLCTLLSGCSWIVLGAGFAASIGLSVASLVTGSANLTLWQLPLISAWLYPWSVFLALSAWLVSQYLARAGGNGGDS